MAPALCLVARPPPAPRPRIRPVATPPPLRPCGWLPLFKVGGGQSGAHTPTCWHVAGGVASLALRLALPLSYMRTRTAYTPSSISIHQCGMLCFLCRSSSAVSEPGLQPDHGHPQGAVGTAWQSPELVDIPGAGCQPTGGDLACTLVGQCYMAQPAVSALVGQPGAVWCHATPDRGCKVLPGCHRDQLG
jgi:hypothetical protein